MALSSLTALALVLAACCSAAALEKNAVEKVITLLEDLKTETEDEGKAEAETYDKFACFCKSTTEEKSDAIKEGQDTIEGLAATLQEQTAISQKKAYDMLYYDQVVKFVNSDMAYIVADREKEKSKYEAQNADLTKGIDSLKGAADDLEATGASLAEKKAFVRKSLLTADILSLHPKHAKTLEALLQEPDEKEGKIHDGTSDILDVLKMLEKDFKARREELNQLEDQNKGDFDAIMEGKTEEKHTAEAAKETAESDKGTADTKISEATDETVEAQGKLKEDEDYMKDLTAKCELKAREWDQRSSMRGEEVEALTKALSIIKNKAKANYEHDAANTKLLQSTVSAAQRKTAALREGVEDDTLGDVDLSFLQVSPRKKLHLLAKAASKAKGRTAVAMTMEMRTDKVINDLVLKGKRLKSPILTSIALRVGADPFLKVKKLIQDLIERLIQEAAEESTKKGWCDTEMGKAASNRDKNMNAVMAINSDIQTNEAKKAQLEADIQTLTEEIGDLNDAAAKQAKLRAEEKAENMETLDKSKAGLAAVKDAKNVLTEFYKKGAKGAVSFVQSPVDAPDSPSGAYKGGQEKAGGIVAMLDVIISDFQRSIKVTKDAENDAHREYVEFDRTTKSAIASKETGKSQAEMDAKSTEQNILEEMDDLDAKQKMVDDALKTLEDLKPACVDTGMSYADRVAKREEEINALKKAMCEMDPDKEEGACE